MSNHFQGHLLAWYEQNQRPLPWRITRDPYKIWLSEIILQQTRVDQGLAYFHRFVCRWPDVASLAAADEQEVLRAWQGLGYYSRARNLLKTARQIVELHRGIFPADHTALLKLSGVGPYTAAAIASIAFELPHPVVDGNVMRVLSRVFGVTDPVDSKNGKAQIQALASMLLPKKDPGTFNQALMEFGALQCVPLKPACQQCVLKNQCRAFELGIVANLPLKKKKSTPKCRYFNYLYVETLHDQAHRFLLRKRTTDDIWHGLYEFPLIETEQEVSFDTLCSYDTFQSITKGKSFRLTGQPVHFKHVLTHQHIFAIFYRLVFTEPLPLDDKNDVFLISRNELDAFPLPRLIDRFLNELIV